MVHFSLSISRGGFPSTLLERRAGCSIDVVLVGVHQCMQNFVPQDHKRSRAGFFEGASWPPKFCLLLWKTPVSEDHVSRPAQSPWFLFSDFSM